MQALGQLCHTYWYPLYAYVRLRGYPPEESKELTQEFFARLLRGKTLAYMRRDCGKFRSFLLSAMNHFLVDECRKGRSLKPAAPPDSPATEKVFERNWALAVLTVVYDRLKLEYEQAGQGEWFASLKFCLTESADALPCAELARSLDIAENIVRAFVQRLRQRYCEVLREEIANLVASPAEVEEELRCLFHTVPTA